MIPRKTILVLGAGASKEFGLPLGVELIDVVKAKVDFRWQYGHQRIGSGDDYILDSLTAAAAAKDIDRNLYTRACGKLRGGIDFSLSIDNYLHSHSNDAELVTVGKIAIAKSILDAEKNSKLWVDKNNPERKFSTKNVSDSWIYQFIKILISNVTFESIDTIFKNLAVICFNYDRCFEVALFESLKLSYGISDDRAAEIMSSLSIVHPYGAVGRLPWQGGNWTVPFGDGDRRDLNRVAEEIYLFTEQRSDPDFVKFIDDHVPLAERILFLGFGYYKQNLDLISRRLEVQCEIAGSSFGLSPVDISSISRAVRNRFPIGESRVIEIDLQNLKCFDMITAYSRFLADI